MSATPAIAELRPLTLVRRVLDRVERALRPQPAPDQPAPDRPAPDLTAPGQTAPEHPDPDGLDSTTTRELLVPTPGEPAAARASRQAQDYLERRRRKLNQALRDGR